jgi:hypothetical protein
MALNGYSLLNGRVVLILLVALKVMVLNMIPCGDWRRSMLMEKVLMVENEEGLSANWIG